ncbi:SDR family NAD(P)-dependent oxidoreductase [Ancylobacter polymorphus]|uniref:SDR family oxidoreductase n=1 Tax=Ancylobacter polymorphus TaxID=223390 RepID=A0A9E6ZZX3_9HYPH|nr:SDR family oxidoreductase [Ancylobacter polymorphus]UOK73317.1 SDR family oxidoreductase [Ancylobacter polymorphus]
MPQQVIAVTGTSRGIGAEIAVELASKGHIVGCLVRNGKLPEHERAAEFADRLMPIACDIVDEDALRHAFAQLVERHGRLNGLVNNAGIHLAGPSRSFATADFEKILKVDVLGLFAACREAYPHLLASEGGTIVNIGSFFSEIGAKGSTAYSAAKAAVGAITRCLAAEWGGKGISVLNIAPGYIETDINRDYLAAESTQAMIRERIAVGRPGHVNEVARLVRAIFDERIGFLTGETITIDGGHRLYY